MENKHDLRIKLKELRKTFDIENKSADIISLIRNLSVYKNAKDVMIFYPMKYEINLLDLLKDDKKFYFPRVDGKNLLVCPYNGQFEKSLLKIYEPCSNPVNPDILDLVIVPALAADKNNYRIGYGGGFYDRFLECYPNIKTLTPIFKEFIFDNIPHEEYDKKIDVIVSA